MENAPLREVSVRQLEIVFRALAKRCLPPEVLAAGTPYSVEHLQNKHERVDWDAFVRINANAGRIWSESELELIGGSFFRSPLVRSILLPARLLFTARDLYRWVLGDSRGLGRNMIPSARNLYRELDAEHAELDLTFPPGYAYSREYFVITKGAISGLPCALGLPAADVTLDDIPGGARYRIRFPHKAGVLARLGQGVLWPFTVRAAAQELKETHEVLKQRYLQLDESRAVIEQQTRQLRTAFAVSNVVHGDLELGPTAAAIARTLVEVAGFAAAEVEVTNDLEDRALAWLETCGSPGDPGGELSLSLAVRGKRVGTLRLWPAPGAYIRERLELLESVVPTVCMAIGNALTFKTAVDYRSHLEERVAARTAELARARDHLAETVEQLERAQTTRDRIFANINHEIRTPLSLVLLTVSDIARRLGAQLDDALRDRLGIIETSVHRLLTLVDGLLLLAAGQEGKLKLNPSPRDVAAVLQRLVDSWRAAAEQVGLTLVYRGPEQLVASCDDVAIERAVANLLTNAFKFTPSGGAVEVALARRGDNVDIEVRDTGIGIDAEFKTRIFGRFEQGRPAVRPGQRGSGIGLSIVKEIAEALGGQATVAANAGGGSVFTVRLPAAGNGPVAVEEPGVEVDRVPPPSPAALWDAAGTQTSQISQPGGVPAASILVAEDDPELRAAVGSLLSAEYRVILAPDGMSALQLAKEHVPDLLVSDVGMPGMDGLELTHRFRELTGNRLAPVILLTAYAAANERIAGLEAGAVDYIVKPFNPPELLARVRSQLQLRALALKLSDSEKLAALGTLAAGLTHEIRNPANGVVNAVRPLLELLPPQVLEHGTPTAELLNVISTCAEQIAILSRQLLGFVRQGELVKSEAKVEEVIDRALALAQPALAGVTLERRLDYRGALVCSASLLAQVVMNLLENAAHAAGPGGRVTLTTHVREGRFELDVNDSGPGVAAPLRARLFEPFFTTKAPGAGTGLGLSTSRLVVERHGGSLDLLEPAGSGATFRVSIPFDPDDSLRPPATPARSVAAAVSQDGADETAP